MQKTVKIGSLRWSGQELLAVCRAGLSSPSPVSATKCNSFCFHGALVTPASFDATGVTLNRYIVTVTSCSVGLANCVIVHKKCGSTVIVAVDK